mgnify:CR=1 FL=1
MRIELACGAQFGGGVCAWHRGGGDAAYARSAARTNEGHGTSTLKATGHAYTCCHLRVYGCGYIILEVRVLFYTRSLWLNGGGAATGN